MIDEQDMLFLVKAFVQRESLDFRLSEPARDEWVEYRLNKIREGVKAYPKASWIILNSLSNLGATVRSLRLSPQNGYWDWKAKPIVINFCMCGKDNHWGSVSQECDVIYDNEKSSN